RLRPGRVRGAVVGRMAPARHAEPVRPGGGGGDSVAGGAAAAEEKRGGGLIPLTVPGGRELMLKMGWGRVWPGGQGGAGAGWAEWRRRHQHRARACHYRRRGARPPDD